MQTTSNQRWEDGGGGERPVPRSVPFTPQRGGGGVQVPCRLFQPPFWLVEVHREIYWQDFMVC